MSSRGSWYRSATIAGSVSRLIVKGPQGQVEHTLDLTQGSSVLVGRAPSVDAGIRKIGAAALRVNLLGVPAASVSANHALAWSEDGKTCLRDLGSRNGSWLRLPQHETVELDAQEVVLSLGLSARDTTLPSEPVAPRWNGPSDFGDALAAAAREWFATQGIDVSATVTDGAETRAPDSGMPLATGGLLQITPLATADASWSQLLENVFRWGARHNALYEAEQETRKEGLILASAAIRAAHRDVVEAAQAGARTLVLTGPSGAGKEALAQVFHRHSGRAGPFIALNTSMFSKDFLRSEMFGAEAGSFTGATRRIIGAVERAEGGTLLLDEIGDLPSEVQPMLLRFLDTREFERMGRYGEAQRADVRVVAATHRDLRELVRAGGFRHDLWYRLSVHVVEVPPLRARWDDVVEFLRSKRTQDGSCSLLETLSPAALALLRAHPWEGNFRELANFAERLPRGPHAGSLDEAACRRALERGSLRPIVPVSAPVVAEPGHADWKAWTERAIQAFVEDHAREPASWDDQKEWNEKYLKPLVFYHLSSASTQPRPIDTDALASLASRAATRLGADRGTALKQLTRYFERFGS